MNCFIPRFMDLVFEHLYLWKKQTDVQYEMHISWMNFTCICWRMINCIIQRFADLFFEHLYLWKKTPDVCNSDSCSLWCALSNKSLNNTDLLAW